MRTAPGDQEHCSRPRPASVISPRYRAGGWCDDMADMLLAIRSRCSPPRQLSAEPARPRAGGRQDDRLMTRLRRLGSGCTALRPDDGRRNRAGTEPSDGKKARLRRSGRTAG